MIRAMDNRVRVEKDEALDVTAAIFAILFVSFSAIASYEY